MNINTVRIKANAYVLCNSVFYKADDSVCKKEFKFVKGINVLRGEIDSGVWAVSYLLSMYGENTITEDDYGIILNEPVELIVNGENMNVKEFAKFSCYLDEEIYPLFTSNKSVREVVEDSINDNKLGYSPDYIKNLFKIDSERFERPLRCLGNERFQAMAAIGFVNNKKVFCFPWLSSRRFNYYRYRIKILCRVLKKLGMIVILPIGTRTAKDLLLGRFIKY